MYFDGRRLAEIDNEDIEALVNEHVKEQRYLEYKLTINHKLEEEKHECLLDITSFANAKGGYILVGIRDDGQGRAQKFEPEMVGDVERILQSVKSIVAEHISPVIEGIEAETRKIGENPVLIMRIPESIRKPHMVTIGHKTDFVIRDIDGKRVMSAEEIKEAHNQDLILRTLSSVEDRLFALERPVRQETDEDLLVAAKEGDTGKLLEATSGDKLSEATQSMFMTEIGETPFLRISATPEKPSKNLIDAESDGVKSLLTNPPGSRLHGWNMASTNWNRRYFPQGICQGDKARKYLEVWVNGHVEFWVPLDEEFAWKQPPEEFAVNPLLYPYPVTEYLVTFLRFYQSLTASNEVEGPYIVSMQYAHIKGYILKPYAPGAIDFMFSHGVKPFEQENLTVREVVSSEFNPDIEAYKLLKTVYRSFGLESKAIPFYDEEMCVFEWGP